MVYYGTLNRLLVGTDVGAHQFPDLFILLVARRPVAELGTVVSLFFVFVLAIFEQESGVTALEGTPGFFWHNNFLFFNLGFILAVFLVPFFDFSIFKVVGFAFAGLE